MFGRKGFTMVELLVVLIILAILVAVAAPMYFANIDRARASEAVATMGTIRSALRDYRTSHGAYPTLPINDITVALPTGVGVSVGTTQYFSNAAYSIIAAGSASAPFAVPAAQDFVIHVNGGASATCSGTATDCAVKADEVKVTNNTYILEMDNTGTVWVSYKSGTAGTWTKY
jgi:prepilin-type N-terminal cleavage/methylation domain-containing protein